MADVCNQCKNDDPVAGGWAFTHLERVGYAIHKKLSTEDSLNNSGLEWFFMEIS